MIIFSRALWFLSDAITALFQWAFIAEIRFYCLHLYIIDVVVVWQIFASPCLWSCLTSRRPSIKRLLSSSFKTICSLVEDSCAILPLFIHWICRILSIILWSVKACIFCTFNWIRASFYSSKSSRYGTSIDVTKPSHRVERLSHKIILCQPEIVFGLRLVVWSISIKGWLSQFMDRSWGCMQIIEKAMSLSCTFIFL